MSCANAYVRLRHSELIPSHFTETPSPLLRDQCSGAWHQCS